MLVAILSRATLRTGATYVSDFKPLPQNISFPDESCVGLKQALAILFPREEKMFVILPYMYFKPQ
jgi:hypothetical protein